MIRSILFILLFFKGGINLLAQTPKTWSSAEILSSMEKLNVLGSVLYVAAHPDDENTRLLAWLARDRQYRTGYLSITRGDGGQNLIGEEQGVALGLIRTQELLAARRIDGAEQYFTRAYDFGFSKSTEEALRVWDKEKILADVVWVIRKFQPDIIITRFPPDARAGHGHHSGSAVLAIEAFKAAGDPNRFTEQFSKGVKPWQAKRILWNTFNFGGNNTISNDQFKVDIGTYNALLGKGYGEIAAESRSQHKSQGFGVPASRGSSFEFFTLTGGEPIKSSLMDGITTNWDRVEGADEIKMLINELIKSFSYHQPSQSVKQLVTLYKKVRSLSDSYWKSQKLKEIQQLIEACSALYVEAYSTQPYIVQGDSIRFNLQMINRSQTVMQLINMKLNSFDSTVQIKLPFNQSISISNSLPVSEDYEISQPYWLREKMNPGSFQVVNQELIGKAENGPSFEAQFEIEIEQEKFTITRPVWYKHTDPVKGELFDPLAVVPPVSLNTDPGILLFRKDQMQSKPYTVSATAYTRIDSSIATLHNRTQQKEKDIKNISLAISKGMNKNVVVQYSNSELNGTDVDLIQSSLEYKNSKLNQANYLALASIQYDHIPPIKYFYQDGISVLNLDIRTSGKKAGYVKGAGDKIPEALIQLGYQVDYLDEKALSGTLSEYDVIVMGVRAYNIHEWLVGAYPALMKYVEEGGVLLAQYNTNSFVGPLRGIKIGPYDLTISNGRITDENSAVQFVDPGHPLLNWPNKISNADFNGWIQERGIYFADRWSTEYKPVLAMRDPGEKEDRLGSIVMASHGKGRFIYTGLVLFRQLPAAVPGAYRLFANLIANPNYKSK
ncbi:MAG: PIG-L family deacetylase [Sphingobacteriales bacterium]|jgi:LmbE family N-acetylglucosaminyl deacetylase